MAIPCDNCGYAYNPDNSQHCLMCGSALGRENLLAVAVEQHIEDRAPGGPPPSHVLSRTTSSAHSGRPDIPQSSTQQTLSRQPGANEIEGRLSHLDRHDERPRTDIFKVMSGVLIGVPVLIPFGVLFLVLGIFSFAFAFLGFSSLSQLLNPLVWITSSFELLEVMVLRRVGRKDTLPVYRGMVEDSNGQERAFVLRGPLILGNLVVGNHVRLSGHFRSGTFIAREGYDLTMETAISSGYRNPWRTIFFAALFVDTALALGILTYLGRLAG